ncbi:MAG: ribonuclease P protein component [Bacteroidaceae bacterium]|nr:ribonuclease P protein component [Bacteroidaceae bacterium]
MDNGFGLKKAERLCSKKAIDALFTGTDSKSLSAYPIRIVYRHTEEAGIRILVSVSKKRFRHAVDRNRAKRQIREAYRLNKHRLDDIAQASSGMDIAFIWLTDRHQPSQLVTAKMVSLLDKIAQSAPTP